MPNLQSTVEKLSRTQQGLLAAADAVSATHWQTPPDANSWSAAHLVAHLCQVERSVLGYADRVIRKTPLHVPYLQRFHVPFLVVEKRFLDETHDRDLSVYYWPHPFLGQLNFYNWFTFIAVHQVRHTKQMVDIAKNLPKRVVPS